MPKLCHRPPRYRKHKASGQAVVTISGRDHYLGPWRSDASRREYDRLIAEYLAHGRTLAKSGPDESLTVTELIALYLRWARDYYQGSSEYDNVKLSFRPLENIYGRTAIGEFGPLKLKAVRDQMIAANLCRNEVNKRVNRIKRLFRWGTENELVPPAVFHGLQSVRGLARGRSQARESKRVTPVPDADVDAIEPHVMPQVWAMVQLQRFTGMRPGEVTRLRTGDLDMSDAVWIYSPPEHKTNHYGHTRNIFLGPRAQQVVRPWLKPVLDAYLFSPKEAVAAWRAERSRLRTTPRSCGNRPGSNRKRNPRKQPGDYYEVRAYHRAIKNACKAAGVSHWHPHQLRHNAATRYRKEFGLDTTSVLLGHRSTAITEIYAEIDHEKARQAMSEIG